MVRWFVGYWDVEINDKIIEWLFGRCSWFVYLYENGRPINLRRIVFLLKSLEISICRASHISDLKKHKFAMSSRVLFVFSHSELSSTHRQSLAECRDEISS